MSNKGIFCAVLVSMGVCAPYGGSADGIYTLKQSITSGGIDLTALDGAWRKDALAAEASGTYQPIAVTGKVVHATSAGSPFVVSNALEKTYFVLEGADLLGNTPVKTTGKGTVYFSGVSMTNIGDTAQNDLICATNPDAAKGATQIDSLCLSGTAAPARYEIVSAPLYVRYNTYLGADGGRGELYATKRCLGRDNDQTQETPWLGRRGNANLYFGYASGKDKGFASGRLHLVNALAAGWYVYFGHADNGVPAASGPHYAAEVVLEGKSARMQALWYHVAGSADSIIRFRGGHLATFGWGNFLTFDENSSGDLILEGENGHPVDLKMNRYAEIFSWGKGSTGRCIFRGDCDVYLYGGDGAGQNDGIDTAGGVRYRDPERRVVWEQTGDLCFFYGGAIAKFFTDDFFPCNPWNGGVKVVAHATQFFALNLLGTSHRCNSLFGGGIVSNSYEKTSVVTIGENGNDCLFDVVLGEDGPIDIVKEGAGRLTLEKPVHDTFTLAGGTAVIPEGSTFTTPGKLVTVAGSVIETAKTFRPPADYDMNAPETARFVLQKSAVLEVGSDGADQTVDLSKVSGISSSSIRKIGSNKVTFVNKTSFAGALEVQSGTCVFDDTTLTSCVKRVSVASGATLHLVARARLETGSFVVGDVTAEANTLYTGGMFESLTGAGELFVAPARLEWTGARDDNPETSSNWANGADKYVLTSGLSLAYFGEHDTEGVWNVADGYVFGGFDFSEHVTTFTFDKTAPSGALALDSQGLVADEARAADSPAALTFNTPLSWTGAWTPLDIAENVNATFNGPWCGVASQDQTIVKYGAGNVYVRGEHATYTGSLIISNGTVYAYGEEPFGPQNESGTARIELNPTDTEAKKRLVLSGTTIGKDIILNTSSSYRRGLVCAAGTTNVITGYLDGSGVCAMVIDKNAKLVLKGGYGKAETSTSFYANWGGSGTLAIENKPMYIGMLEGGLGNLHISVPGNKIEAMRAWHKTDNYYPHGVNLTVDCDWAFDLKNAIFCTKGTIDFRGTSQRLGAIYNAGTYISQTGLATLYLAATNSISASFNRLAAPPSPGDFAGQFSLVVEAARDFTFAITDRAVSATGTVAVTSGTLAFVNGASWLNATNVTVSGSGRLEINQSETFGRKSNFDLSGGTLALADGVVQKAQFLYVDGVKMPLGVYGASDNAALTQSFRTPYIAGSGVLEVMGDGVGTFILLK